MEGMVHSVNPCENLLAVDTIEGYVIVEQLAADFEVGDLVEWEGTPRGRVEVFNRSKNRKVFAYFLHHGVAGTLVRVNLQL